MIKISDAANGATGAIIGATGVAVTAGIAMGTMRMVDRSINGPRSNRRRSSTPNYAYRPRTRASTRSSNRSRSSHSRSRTRSRRR